MSYNDTFGANETQNCNTSFGTTETTTAPTMISVDCLDIYNHSSKNYDIPNGTSIDAFFKNHLNISSSPKNFIVKINGMNAEAGQTLGLGDSVQVTPTKIQGG
jgi:hypothetical protein